MHLLKRINKYKLEFKSWITLGLEKSVSVKNKLPVNFINRKDLILKAQYQSPSHPFCCWGTTFSSKF